MDGMLDCEGCLLPLQASQGTLLRNLAQYSMSHECL
jgi:hypothetical protein